MTTVRWRVRRNVVEEPLPSRRLRGVRWARRNINRMWERECLSERYAISPLPLGFLWHRQSPSALLHFNHRPILVSIAYLIGRYRNMISHMKYSVALCPAPRQRTHVAIVPILFMWLKNRPRQQIFLLIISVVWLLTSYLFLILCSVVTFQEIFILLTIIISICYAYANTQ